MLIAYTEEDKEAGASIPETNLIAAIIVRALLDREIRHGAFAHHARLWLYSPDRDPWSFLWCCSTLSLSPQKILSLPYESLARTAREYTRGQGRPH